MVAVRSAAPAVAMALVVVVALAGGALVACGGDDADGGDALPEVRFGFIQAVDIAPYLAMRDQGFDRANGFVLVEEVVAGGRAAIEGITAGTLDASYAGSLPLLTAARAGSVPGDVLAVGVATVVTAAHPTIAVLGGAGVETWSDLDGKVIGVNQVGSIGEVAAGIRLRREGVQGATFAEIPFPNLGLAVARGDIDAAVMVEPYLAQSLRRDDGTVLDWVIGGEPFPDFVQAFIVVRAGLARNDPDLVRRLLRAHLDAVAWIEGNETAARALVARRLALDDEVAQAMEWPAFASDGRVDADVLASMQTTLADDDDALVPLPAGDVVDEHLLLEVLDDA